MLVLGRQEEGSKLTLSQNQILENQEYKPLLTYVSQTIKPNSGFNALLDLTISIHTLATDIFINSSQAVDQIGVFLQNTSTVLSMVNRIGYLQ